MTQAKKSHAPSPAREEKRHGASRHREVAALAKRVVQAVKPIRVVLFGSHARGETQSRSDVDLLVIVPDGWDEMETRAAAMRAVRGSRVPCDVVVATEGRVRRFGNLVGTVFRPALRDGRLLYDATAHPGWLGDTHPVRMEVDPVTEELRLAETRRWLHQARTDLQTAELALASAGLDPDPACYHAQQAAEKALKAVLVFLQVDYPFTHSLDEILADIPEGWRVKDEFGDLETLSNWSFMAHYPGEWSPPASNDAQVAIALARAIYESVEQELRARGLTEDAGR